MKKTTIKYTVTTIMLVIGLMVFIQGSRSIIKTYQRETTYIETAKIGRFPTGTHLELVEQKGFKDGLLHILVQVSGLSISIFGLYYMMRASKK